jgi:hypothetical protein
MSIPKPNLINIQKLFQTNIPFDVTKYNFEKIQNCCIKHYHLELYHSNLALFMIWQNMLFKVFKTIAQNNNHVLKD